MKTKLVFYICLLGLITSSCRSFLNIEKRKYRPGYSVQWKNAKHNTTVPKTKEDNPVKVNIARPVLLASVETEKAHPEIKQRSIINFMEECNDSIFFKSGSSVRAKVIEITPKEIKYSYCDTLENSTFVIAINNILRVKYANGTIKVFQEPENISLPENNSPDYIESKIARNSANLSLLTYPAGFFLIAAGAAGSAFLFGLAILSVCLCWLFFVIRGYIYGKRVLERATAPYGSKARRRAKYGRGLAKFYFIVACIAILPVAFVLAVLSASWG